MERLFAGIDSSTQGTKLVVIDLDKSKVIYTDSVNYDNDLKFKTKNGVMQGLAEGVSESDPNMWIEALQVLFKKLRVSKIPINKIKAISVSGQQHGLVTLDREGNLTRSRSKLWNDFSTEAECALMTKAVGGLNAMVKQVGNSQRTGYTAAKICHMARHEAKAREGR